MDPPVGACGQLVRPASTATTRASARPRHTGVAKLTAIDSAAPRLDGGAAALLSSRTAEHR
jgi:hypothetical protein